MKNKFIFLIVFSMLTCVVQSQVTEKKVIWDYSLQINMWVIGNLLHSENRSILQEYDQQKIQTALKMCLFVDIDVDMLYQQTKKYVYENE